MTVHRFGDIDFRIQKKEIKTQFYNVLTDLRTTLKQSPFAVRACEKFRDCLEHPENDDLGRLPEISLTKAPQKYKEICYILLTIENLIVLYWNFCDGNKTELLGISEELESLEGVVKKGVGKE